MTEEETKIINRTSSEIRTMISENNIHGLSEESLVNYISILLRDAGVDSKLVVEILNKVNPDSEVIKEEILSIKVNEGW